MRGARVRNDGRTDQRRGDRTRQIDCDAAVLAGGAWSRLFCGNMGIDFPQLKILGSVMRTEPIRRPAGDGRRWSGFRVSQTRDGGYTVARRNKYEAFVVPDSFRLLPQFPARHDPQRARNIGCACSAGFARKRASRGAGRWTRPARSRRPVCWTRPQSGDRRGEPGGTWCGRSRPSLRRKIAQAWGGLIDTTPDAVPVIGPVDAVPGFFLMSGFSGHGFGIGPGAGRLMAELVTGATPVVDPAPFRFDRFGTAGAAAH